MCFKQNAKGLVSCRIFQVSTLGFLSSPDGKRLAYTEQNSASGVVQMQTWTVSLEDSGGQLRAETDKVHGDPKTVEIQELAKLT